MTDEGWETACAQLSLEADDLKNLRPQTPEIGRSFSHASNNAASQSTPPDDIALDHALESALDQPRERLNMLKFEDRIVRFMKSPKDYRLEFPPMSGFHRLLVHRLAIRFGLEHQSIDIVLSSGGVSGQHLQDSLNRDCCPMVLTKTAHCSIPKVLLIDMADTFSDATSSKSSPSKSPNPPKGQKILLMKREPPRAKQSISPGESVEKTQLRSVAEKEKAYAAARARIFGISSGSESGCSDDGTVKINNKNRCNSSSSVSTIDERSARIALEERSISSLKTKKDSVTNKKELVSSEGKTQKDTMTSPSSISTLDHNSVMSDEDKVILSKANNIENLGNSKKTQVVNAGEWLKDGKVKARRRGENASDPDFQRNFQVIRPNVGYYPNPYAAPGSVPMNAAAPQFIPDNQYMIGQGGAGSAQMHHSMYYNNKVPVHQPVNHHHNLYLQTQQYGVSMQQPYTLPPPQQQHNPRQETNYYAIQLAQQQAAQLAQQQQMGYGMRNMQHQQSYAPNLYARHHQGSIQQQNAPRSAPRVHTTTTYNENFPALS